MILVRGTKPRPRRSKEQTAEFMREQMRLSLSPEKTHITHVDDGFDVLGWRDPHRGRRREHTRSCARNAASLRDLKRVLEA